MQKKYLELIITFLKKRFAGEGPRADVSRTSMSLRLLKKRDDNPVDDWESDLFSVRVN